MGVILVNILGCTQNRQVSVKEIPTQIHIKAIRLRTVLALVVYGIQYDPRDQVLILFFNIDGHRELLKKLITLHLVVFRLWIIDTVMEPET